MQWGGKDEMFGKSNMETYITICEIDSQWEFAVWLRKFKQGLCINLEGWDGEGASKRRAYMYTWLDGITNSLDISLSELREMVKEREIWCAAIHEVAKSHTQLSD